MDYDAPDEYAGFFPYLAADAAFERLGGIEEAGEEGVKFGRVAGLAAED